MIQTPDNLLPLNDRIFIRVLNQKTEYSGLVTAVDYSKEKSNVGVVIRLPINYNSPNNLTVGDKIMFPTHSGSILKFDLFDNSADEYRLIKESEFLGLINEPDS